MKYVINLPDSVEFGITAAREAANAERPDDKKYALNADYVAAVLAMAAQSWCVQYAERIEQPPAGSVALGVPVDATVGTAALSPTALLGADLKARLENCATVQTTGDQLAAFGA